MSRFRDILFITSVCGASVLNIFVNGALVIALPTLGKALNFTQAELQWPLNVYALSYGSLLLFFGRLADVTGNKRMFLCGTGWFAIWSIVTSVAPNKVTFIVCVAMTGIGAAANTPTGIGIFANHFESGKTKNRAIAALGGATAIGYIIGLIGGGFLCQGEKLWRAIFYIQSGLAGMFFVLGMISIPSDAHRAKYEKGIDTVGAILSITGVGLLTYVLSQSTVEVNGWKTPWIIAVFLVSLLILVAFVFWEIRAEKLDKAVIVPMSLWKKPGARMGPTVLLVFLVWGSYNSLSYWMTLFFQQIREDTPIQTALETMPFVIMALVANIVAGVLLEHVRGDILIAIGLCGSIAAPLIFSLIDVNASYWKMAFPIMLTISWTDVAYVVGNLQISISFDADSQGLAGGIFNVSTRLGTAISLAITSSIANAVSKTYNEKHPELPPDSKEVLMDGFRAAGWTTLALAIAACVVWVYGVRGIGIIGKKVHVEDVTEKGSRSQHLMEDLEAAAMHNPNLDLERVASDTSGLHTHRSYKHKQESSASSAVNTDNDDSDKKLGVLTEVNTPASTEFNSPVDKDTSGNTSSRSSVTELIKKGRIGQEEKDIDVSSFKAFINERFF